jgi:hypothetical protein
MKLYRSREGDVTAVDTKTQLTTLGSETAPGPLLVPNIARRIAQLIVTGISDMATNADTAYFCRLEGPGLTGGPEAFAVGADGAQVATGGQAGRIADIIDVNIPVTSNQEILIFGEMAGEDQGQMTMGVTVVFES